MKVIVQRVQSVQLGAQNAALLKSRLHLTHVMATDLRQIIQHAMTTTLQLLDLVKALLLIPSTGKYIAQLCPYCKHMYFVCVCVCVCVCTCVCVCVCVCVSSPVYSVGVCYF